MIRWAFLHHRCASRLVASLLRQSAEAAGWTVSPVLNWADHAPTLPEVRDLAQTCTLVLSGNARTETPGLLDRITEETGRAWRGIHVTRRRPWGLLQSAYLSHLRTHPLETLPGLDAHRERLRTLPIEEGIACDAAFYVTRQALDAIQSDVWQHPHIRETHLDDWGDAAAALRPLWAWLELPATLLDAPLTLPPTLRHPGELHP